MEITQYLIKNDDVLFTSMGEDAVLLHVNRGDYYSLNKVGARLWILTDGSKSIADLAGLITEEFEITREAAEKDILELAEQLVSEGLVKVAESPEDDKPAEGSA
ncbi:hypothetical protein BMS3Abin01_00232 [bacterium BMS3Abin01]|nr:hypothetical protein BMS3Abin01_00232 [bacterium BMS3Abin01]